MGRREAVEPIRGDRHSVSGLPEKDPQLRRLCRAVLHHKSSLRHDASSYLLVSRLMWNMEDADSGLRPVSTLPSMCGIIR